VRSMDNEEIFSENIILKKLFNNEIINLTITSWFFRTSNCLMVILRFLMIHIIHTCVYK
jgi:hypothetical protein